MNTAFSQPLLDASKFSHLPYQPKVAVNGTTYHKTLSLDSLLMYGLQVVLADNGYRVLQFDIVFDCPSKALFDFSIQRYLGDRVSPSDEYLRKRIFIGDVIDVCNTVIGRGTEKLVMKCVSYQITK